MHFLVPTFLKTAAGLRVKTLGIIIKPLSAMENKEEHKCLYCLVVD